MAHQTSTTVTAADFFPERLTLPSLKKAAAHCEGCPLFARATQTVFGEGPADARVIMVGEQPGDQEDVQGRPFVGPAGKLLDRAMEDAGMDRGTVYVTNAVKHFKWTPRGKRRLHSKPTAREISACRPWLEAEMEVIEPQFFGGSGRHGGPIAVGTDVSHHARAREAAQDRLGAGDDGNVSPVGIVACAGRGIAAPDV